MVSRVEFLLKGVDDGWRITHFAKLLDGLTSEEANWRPAPEINSIVEILNHVAYWLEYRARQVRGESLEPLKPIPAAGEALSSGSPRPIIELVSNIVAHNAYRAGQIVLLRRLWALRTPTTKGA